MEHNQHIDFHLVTVADKPLFDAYMARYEVQNCDLAFANIFAWSDTYHSEVAEVEEFLVVRFDVDGTKGYMQPIGDGDRAAVLERLRQDAFAHRVPLRLYGLTAEWRTFLEKNYPSEFAFDAPRALCDYIYRTEELAQLRGSKFQPKRNHINRFVARYDWRTESLSGANVADCLALNERWLRGREIGDTERAEQRALHRAFENFEALGLRGLVLYADNSPVAFTYGTPISAKTFCTHIEKYDSEVEGAATMINREFARTLSEEFEFVNREDDLGLEGLRFAKLSYHPSLLLEKISALHLTPEQREMREMWHEIFGDEYHEIESFLVSNPQAIPFIYKEEGSVVAMLHIVPLQMWGQSVAYIYAVATQPEYRGRGIASKLLNEALHYISESGKFDCVALIPSSTESKRLYERLGFDNTQKPMIFSSANYLGTGFPPSDLAMTKPCK